MSDVRAEDPPPSRLRATIAAAVVPVVPALLVAVPAFGWVWEATVRASWGSLGRDQGIFQYVAWAVGKGDVAYRDVRDVNGPVIPMVHAFFQALGGTDEHRFRVLDLLCTGLSFAIAGALLPSIVSGARRSSRRSTIPARAVWAFAAWVALSAQYLVYGFWDTAQRESFLDWFLLVAIALQATPVASADPRTRPAMATLLAAGAMSFVPWLGKPTFALFTVAQLATLALEPGDLRTRGRRLALFLGGGALGTVPPFAYLVLRGDVGAWARITFVDVPAMYRFIWPRPASAILSLPGYATLAQVAVVTSLGLAALVAMRWLPRRTIPIAAMPVLGLASVVIQAKGFPYHFHPVTLGMSFGWLVALAAIWDRARERSRTSAVVLRVAVLVASVLVGVRAGYLGWCAPYPPAPPPDARDKAALESADRLSAFDRIDYFPRAMRDAAEYVAARTSPDDRVQTYAMDAYLLFLAGRRSATPYIYAYDLDADAAMHGSFDPGGLVPTAEQAERIRALRDEHARDLHARLERAPPAAFVFVDRSPLMSWQDSVADFSEHCPETAAWMASRYRQTADFDGIRVWLRDDLAAREP